MSRLVLSFCWLVGLTAATAQQPEKPALSPVPASVRCTLGSATKQVRQLAFDGNAETFFASATNPQKDDDFTLLFDEPIEITAIEVTTGRPDGQDKLTGGRLETSANGRNFDEVAAFENGLAQCEPKKRRIVSLRIKPHPQDHPLVVREIAIKSTTPVTVFRYPVEIAVNVADAPEMKAWADNVAQTCERAYAMINDELKSDGFQPTQTITMTLKRDYKGVAATSGFDIVGSVKFFQDHPDDVGAMIHETVHCVQRPQAQNVPGWLIEGIADYVRFFKFEPGKLGRIAPQTARYNGSYRTSASFLAFLNAKYDPQLVLKLNATLRDPKVTYSDALIERLTGKTIPELETEWRASLR